MERETAGGEGVELDELGSAPGEGFELGRALASLASALALVVELMSVVLVAVESAST